MLEWLKKIVKCKIRGIHKISLTSGHCVRCGKQVNSDERVEL